MKQLGLRKKHIFTVIKSFFWFSCGVMLGVFLFSSFAYILFTKVYQDRIYPGVMIGGDNFGGKTEKDVQTFFADKNELIGKNILIFEGEENVATISAKDLGVGYDEILLAKQAYSLGRTSDIATNASLIMQAYLNGINLPSAFRYSDNAFEKLLAPIKENMYIAPVDALFSFQDGKVVAFQESKNGQELSNDNIIGKLNGLVPIIVRTPIPKTYTIPITKKIIKPKVTTEEANNLGIKELLAEGSSLFRGSIPSRMFNISLAAGRLNGLLVKPNQEFSFDQALGDVSSFTGYKQAYIIQNGRTVLGDGGGVCQVSTTFFRALLNAGLPILERQAHAYRVGYYEQDAPPGLDATIYVPSVDLKFKNDTDNHILIQSIYDEANQSLIFRLYGTKDNRTVTLTKPVITKQIPAPEPLYQDDPTLPKGQVKQVDYAAAGATASFSRTVMKNGKVIINETFTSNYRPWQAVYLRGTQ